MLRNPVFYTEKSRGLYTQTPVAVACFCSMPRAPAAKILAARNTALYWKWYFQVTSSRFERRVQDKMRRDLKRIIPHSIRPYGHSLPSYAAGNTSRRLVACLYWRISRTYSWIGGATVCGQTQIAQRQLELWTCRLDEATRHKEKK